jgi:hypothetical protein
VAAAVRAVVVALSAASVAAQAGPPLGELPAPVAAVLHEHCVDCHGGAKPEAGLDLGGLAQRPLADGLAILLRVRDRVCAGEMPPRDYGEPSAQQVQTLAAAVDELSAARVGELARPPAPAARRSSPHFYRNAVADLFGVAAPRAAQFPQEDLNYGFDSVAGALSFTELHVEKYLAAAEAVAEAVIDDLDPERPRQQRVELETALGEGAQADGDFALFLTDAAITVPLRAPRAGRYRLRTRAYGQRAGADLPKLRLAVDGAAWRDAVASATAESAASVEFAIEAERRRPAVVERELQLAAGELRATVAFTNDFYVPARGQEKACDRNLAVDWVELVGPLDRAPIPAGSRWWYAAGERGDRPTKERLRAMLTLLVERAWRAPPGPAVEPLLAVAERARERGESFELQLRAALTALLMSPRFLLRVAADQRPPAYRQAERLAAFLWSSVPDAPLLARARAGGLLDRADLQAQVARMLADARAGNLASDFAAQWLELRQLGARDDLGELASDLPRETELLFEAILREGRDVRELLDADYTFVNARLAAHYGLPGEFTAEFQRVGDLPVQRRGLLGHASILALTSNPTRTSPVKRGKWILENLLDAPVPPPPPGNDSFPEGAPIDSSASLRSQMAEHSRNAACSVCHVRMDGLGLALERFDLLGRWREADAAGAIDDHGVLAAGRTVRGAVELRAHLRAEPAFLRALVTKLYIHAVGQPPPAAARVRLDLALRALPQARVTVQDLVALVVLVVAGV